MTEYLVLVRHGETLPNVLVEKQADGLFYEVSGSDETVTLTELGVQQTVSRGKNLSRRFTADNPIRRIVVSGYKRTHESGGNIASQLSYEVEVVEDRRFDKRSYGDFWNITYRGVQELHPEEYARFLVEGPLNYIPPGGENYPQLFARVSQGLDDFSKLPGNTLIVCHLVVFLAIQRELEGHEDEQVHASYEASSLPNAHQRIYKRESPSEPWQPVDDDADC
ncbi:MAG TPA: histidine phosphatase family protein [Drouetiella sp.]|jgi:2,3-bisphosphoglycerate-dependent phosphoglycerate mutase